jgi:hypothetical protein
MWFKNATLLSLPRDFRIDPLALETAIGERQLRSPGDLEFETRGFLPVINRPALAEFDLIGDPYPPQMSRTIAGATVFAFATETRLLPASILQDAVAKLCQKHEAEHRRGVDLWTNPGDTVLTPFAGIGSELYVAVEMGRRALGVELKASYYQQAVRNMQAMSSQGSLFGAIEAE